MLTRSPTFNVAAAMRRYATTEFRAFTDMHDRANKAPETVAEAEATASSRMRFPEQESGEARTASGRPVNSDRRVEEAPA